MEREVERGKWGWRGGRFEENSGWEAKTVVDMVEEGLVDAEKC
jgi:hypothetical protein